MCDGLDEAGTAVPGENDDGWDGYLAAFHDERPGVTEDVLADASADDGGNPYDWLAWALPRDSLIVDVACGSGPLASRTSHWIGLDRSPAELRLAASIAPGRVVLADAACPPLRAGAADAVVCSMALMLLDTPGAAVAEMPRLLRDGGRFAAMVPATAPLTLRDRMRYVRLLAALRLRRLPFRHPDVLADPRPLLAPAGLTLVSADRRRFAYPLAEPGDARLWLRSLYLPGLDPRRLAAAPHHPTVDRFEHRDPAATASGHQEPAPCQRVAVAGHTRPAQRRDALRVVVAAVGGGQQQRERQDGAGHVLVATRSM